MVSAASPFIVDDAIVGLAQPLTEALNQLARGRRRACDMIEEFGRREDFYLHLAGGLCRRTAGAVFHNAHLPYKLSRANRAEKDGVAIEFPEYVDGTAEEAKNAVRWISFSEEDLPLGEVRASHYGPLNRHTVTDPTRPTSARAGRGPLARQHRLRAASTPSLHCRDGLRHRRLHLADISAPRFAERDVMEYRPDSGSASLRLDAGRLDHLAPFLGFVGDQLAKVGRGAGKHRAA